MFETIIASLKGGKDKEDETLSKRRFDRRSCDKCVTIIDGKTYPVENWSMGGVLIFTDSRSFGLEEHKPMTLKFKLRDQIVEVANTGKVVRKTQNHVAFEFPQVTQVMHNNFQAVIDDHVAAQFANSQL